MIRAFIFDLDGTLYSQSSDLYMTISSLIKSWFERNLTIYNVDFVEFYENMKRDYPNPLGAIQAFGLNVTSYYKEVFEKRN